MKFEQLIGQDKIVKHLIHEVLQQRTPHAQLFSGPEGSGNLATALAFAQFMMCESPIDQDSCGTCGSCIKNSKLIHPDLHFTFPVIPYKSGVPPVSADYIEKFRAAVLDNPYLSYFDWMEAIDAENKQGNITVAECKSIIGRLSLKPFESKVKVLIIWMPEFLGDAGNSLLKIIEEPTPNTHFLLVCNEPEEILATILSRVQMVKIDKIKDDKILQFLLDKGVDEKRSSWITFMADGNLNSALKLALDEDDSDTHLFQEWMQKCLKNDMEALMEVSDKISALGKVPVNSFLIGALQLIREANALKYIDAYQLRIDQEHHKFISSFGGFINHEISRSLYESINTTIYNIERNANLKIEVFQLSLTLREILTNRKKEKRSAKS
jgi:DNA polymerase-3 subunit delta'